MGTNELSKADVDGLIKNPSAKARAMTAEKLATDFVSDRLSEEEKTMAEEIFRLLVNDADVTVRKALADILAKVPNVPKDVALALAHDVKSVSLPVISASELLNDEDLLRLIQDKDRDKNLAIADRNGLSETLSDVLVNTGDPTVASRVISNETAKVSQPTFETALDRYGENQIVQNAMIARKGVPADIVEVLVSKVSQNLMSLIQGRSRISDSVLMGLLLRVREDITLSISETSDDDRLWELVTSLKERGRLTSSIIVRSICMGDLRFFEMALAAKTNLPLENVVQLVYDPGERGLEAICKSAELPQKSHFAIVAAVRIANEGEMLGIDMDRDQFSRRMIERVLSHTADLGVELEDSDLNFLLDHAGIDEVVSNA